MAQVTVAEKEKIRVAITALKEIKVKTRFEGEVSPRSIQLEVLTPKQAQSRGVRDGEVRLRSKTYPHTTLYFIDVFSVQEPVAQEGAA
jgi:hypothetical protein